MYNKKECFTNNNIIPKKIWTYWNDDKMPELIIKCIDTWKNENKDYEITILKNKRIM